MAIKEKNSNDEEKRAVSAPHSLCEMTRKEFDSRMAAGLADAKAGRAVPVDKAFDQLRAQIETKSRTQRC